MSGANDDDRFRRVQEQAAEWADTLIDLSSKNTLLHFKNPKTASLDLTNAERDAVTALLCGTPTRLGELFHDPDQHKTSCQQVRQLRRKINAAAEEQGIEVGKVAHGFVKATPKTTSPGAPQLRTSRAPLLLRSLEIESRTVTENDFTLRVDDEVTVNPVFLYALVSHYGVDLDITEFTDAAAELVAATSDPDEQLDEVYGRLEAVVRRSGVPISLEHGIAIGLFNYEKQPMVEDLRNSTELLAGHDLVAALANVEGAAEAVRADAADFVAASPNDLPPNAEYLVHDADSSQQRAITTALSGHHVLIEGPPGTGKSQTIANIIAGAAAQGKRVLFVAEKRAAIEAVTDRLAQVGLDKLVFDLHQHKLDKRHIARQLQISLEAMSRQTQPQTRELHSRLAERRSALLEQDEELHKRREPWDISAYEVQSELLAMRHPASPHSFRRVALRKLDEATVKELEDDLRSFVELGGLRVLRKESPWSEANIQDASDIERVLHELDELTSRVLDHGQRSMSGIVKQTGLREPSDYAGWQDVLDLLDAVNRCVEAFGSDVFSTELDDWWYATADRSQRRQAQSRMSWFKRRALLKRVRAASRDGITKKPALHAKLDEAVRCRERWQELAQDPECRPSEVVGLADAMDVFQELRTQLTSVALCARLPDVEHKPTEVVNQQLRELHEDQDMLWHMDSINKLREKFDELGLSQLLDDIAQQKLDGDRAWMLFRYVWLKSLLDQFRLDSPALRGFSPERHSRLVDEYRQLDIDHRDITAQRVSWEVARTVRRVRDDFPEESRLLKNEANKKSRHLPPRRLVEKAPHVLLGLRPCWAMSPLVVSRTLPPEKLFDIVIFDEASQIKPHDAVATIARGTQLVVAGDDNQLPPTTFFDRMLGGDDAEEGQEEAALKDYESILTAMRSLIPHQERLKWHYRSADERLIAFSNAEIYGNQLVTFPGTATESPVTLHVVDGVAGPGREGSASAEVDRVVELAVEHARNRPHESLGVITLGQPHADRIDHALRRKLQEHPDLQEFFTEQVEPGRRFFTKNLERVQGDERDAIIFSLGVAKRASGAVALHGFGPLNQEGGHRRLNVAVTRAKRRMTVVSSFGPQDLPPKVQHGTELLRRYLEFAAHHGNLDRVGRQTDVGQNGFERDVERALVERGIEVYPQWGFSGHRIDFALAHPKRPGQMVLAVEADGDRYHNTHSARDRDRLRQAHLEALGWRFHRVWASSWFSDREAEADKIVKSWEQAVADADKAPVRPSSAAATQDHEPDDPAVRRGPRPDVPRGLKTTDYTEEQLIALCRWLLSDGLQLDRDERLGQALRELGKRRGRVITERLHRALDIAQSQQDREDA